MGEIILGLVIGMLLVERWFGQRANDAEMRHLVNMVQARNTAELLVLDRADKAPVPHKDPEAAKPIYHPIGA